MACLTAKTVNAESTRGVYACIRATFMDRGGGEREGREGEGASDLV